MFVFKNGQKRFVHYFKCRNSQIPPLCDIECEYITIRNKIYIFKTLKKNLYNISIELMRVVSTYVLLYFFSNVFQDVAMVTVKR